MTSADAPRNDAAKEPSHEMLWLILILTVAAALRFYRLGAPLWYDEISTLVEFVRPSLTQLVTTYPSLNHHVLFSLEAKLATDLFGESAWALRLPAALLGVGSIAAAWLLARQIVSRTESLFVALLLALSYHHIWFSQNARGYTGLLFWGLLATYFLLRGARNPSPANWAAYGVALAAAMYTHLSAAFLFVGHALVYAVLFIRRRLRSKAPALPGGDDAFDGFGPLVGFAIGGALTLAVLAPLIPDMIETFTNVSGVGEGGRDYVAEWKNPLWTIGEIASSLFALGPLMAIGLPSALILVSAGFWDITRRRPVAAALFVAHIPLTIVILLAFSFRIWPRYFFIDAGFAFIFLVRGVYVIAGWTHRELERRKLMRLDANAIGLGLCLVMAAASLVLLPRNYEYPKQDFAGAAAFIEAERAAEDAVASIGLARLAYTTYYAPAWGHPETKAELEALMPPKGRLWVVYAFRAHTRNKYPDIMADLDERFEFVREFPGTLGDGYVFVYRSKPSVIGASDP